MGAPWAQSGYASFLAVSLLLSVPSTTAATARSPLYSQWMASSIASRSQGILTGQEGSSGLLQAGFVQKAFHRLVTQYPDHGLTNNISSYIKSSVDSVIPLLKNATLDTSYPLDRLSNGNNIITLYKETGNSTYLSTLNALRHSVDLQRRNQEGGLWYYVYPNFSYLDGMYSYAPFEMQDALVFNKTNIEATFQEVTKQLDLLWSHCYDNVTGLLVHGYDYSKIAVWANSVTGASAFVWGRSLGWYLMALVDTLEIMYPYRHLQQWMLLKSKYVQLSTAVVNAVDPVSGAWWQVLSQPGREGNYIESSGSSMFVYALLKGGRLGWLNGVENVAEKAYGYLVDTFVDDFHNGTLGWNGTVSVCSLNSTASYSVGPYKTRMEKQWLTYLSSQYYISQPLLYNSVLGSGAFVLASLEHELLA
jgi:rhamnogalacturonyl hydrolase YesR